MYSEAQQHELWQIFYKIRFQFDASVGEARLKPQCNPTNRSPLAINRTTAYVRHSISPPKRLISGQPAYST